ncbi:MAG: AmmeMemoRadiSam system radical SAM enzyme, partial [Pseudomonadota bacterium]
GKLITPAEVAWALAIGADFITSARGFMFSLGCIQALKCNKNTCPTCLDDQIVLTTYGRSSGFCIDPIEKKPLNHFYPGTPVLSFGTAGCNLACKFCQNWDISKSRQMDSLADAASPETLAKAAKNNGCRSVAFTYNDPVIFHEYAIDVAAACHENDIKTVAVSAGYVSPEPRQEFYQHIDAVNIDLKAFSEKFYRKITGSHLLPVLETLSYLKHETKVWFEITNLVIPGENDSEKEINQMTEWIFSELGPDVPLHFSAFHPDWKMRDKPRTTLQSLQKARSIAIINGLHNVYTGNVHDPEGDTTYCHHCGEELIIRDWYNIKKWNLSENGTCPSCNEECAGIFDSKPGNWGAKRQPIQLNQTAISQ